jgi:hypothetical protein
MADTFRWPPEHVDIEAMDLDREGVVPAVAGRRPAANVARPMSNEQPRSPQSSTDRLQADPVQTEPVRTEHVQTARVRTEPAGLEPVAKRPPLDEDEQPRSRLWSESVGRWAVVALGFVVLIETGWLIARPLMVKQGAALEPRAEPTDRSSGASGNSEPRTVQNAVADSGSAVSLTNSRAESQASVPGPLAAPALGATSAVPSAVREPVSAGASQPTDVGRPAVQAAPGWVTIPLSIQVQVFENGRFVGTNDTNQIPIAAGRHQLEFVNESLHYKASQRIEVGSGKVATLKIALPTGTLNLNAAPWAEVTIDGQSVGQTPLGNVQLPIGPHQVVFRHPELGEQTRSIVVGAGSATRISVDFRK